jgi:hypothetical protein
VNQKAKPAPGAARYGDVMGTKGMIAVFSGCLGALVLAGCGVIEGKSCSLIGCLSAIGVRGLDSGGQVIRDLRGTIQFEGKSQTFNCVGSNECFEGTYNLYNAAESQPDLVLDLTDGQGRRYTGTVKPTYVVDEDFNGEGCGTCTSGAVSVTLQ